MVLIWILALPVFGIYFYFDIKQSFPLALLPWTAFPIEWLWFRWFDRQYPTDDIDRPPILAHYAATFEQPKPHELLIVLLLVVGYFGMIFVLF